MKTFKTLAALSLGLGMVISAPVMAANDYDVVFGKNKDWLFTGYEYLTPADAPNINQTITNLVKANQLFRQNGTALVIVLVPSKIRIYGSELPPSRPLTPFADQVYAKSVAALRANGVNVVDLNTPFMAANRTGDNQLYFKLDTHWTPKGAALAAENIKQVIMATPELKKAWEATPPVAYSLTWAARPRPSRARDLVHYLPPGTATFPPENVLTFTVARQSQSSAGLTGAGERIGITTIGSSFSDGNTGYPNAVRTALQRNVLEMSLPVDQGPWSGMVNYLGKEFKTSKPNLIIWEIPERELRAPPAATWREARYRIDNAKWLSSMEQLLK